MYVKYKSVLLVLILVITLGTGCSSQKEEQVVTDLNLPEEDKIIEPEWGANIVVWGNEDEKEFIELAITEFNKLHSNVTITFEAVNYLESADKIELYGQNGEGADVFSAPHDKVNRLLTAGLLLENNLIHSDQFFQSAIDSVAYKGKIYGYPTEIITYALFYNKDIVQTPVNSFEDIFSFATEYNDSDSDKYAIIWEISDPYFDYMFLGGYNAILFGDQGKDREALGFNTNEGLEAMGFYQSLRNIVEIDSDKIKRNMVIESFEKGKVPYLITGSWNINRLDEDINFGVTKLPLLPNDKTPVALASIRNNYVSSFTKYPKAAKLFANFMSSKEMLKKRFEITSQIPPRIDVEVEDDRVLGILQQAKYTVPMPSLSEINTYLTVFSSIYENIWNGADIKEELEKATLNLKNNNN